MMLSRSVSICRNAYPQLSFSKSRILPVVNVGLFKLNGKQNCKQNYSGGAGGATNARGPLKWGAATIGGALGNGFI
jgi:hypothetical protein